ncbi:MAG: hypothetical protein ACOC5T_00440 [Elusimicrobiota bacterium]
MKAVLTVKQFLEDDISDGDVVDVEVSLITLEDKVCRAHVQYIFKTKKSYSITIAKNCSDIKFDHITDMYKAKGLDDFCPFCDEKKVVYSKANKIYANIAKDVGVDVKWYNNEILV